MEILNDKRLIKLIDKVVEESNADRIVGIQLSKQVLKAVDNLVNYVKLNY